MLQSSRGELQFTPHDASALGGTVSQTPFLMVLLKKVSVVVRQAHHPEFVEGRLRIVYSYECIRIVFLPKADPPMAGLFIL
jgi:hypothetical protein